MDSADLILKLDDIKRSGWARHFKELAQEIPMADLAVQCEAEGMASFSAKTNDYARFGYGPHTIPGHAHG